MEVCNTKDGTKIERVKGLNGKKKRDRWKNGHRWEGKCIDERETRVTGALNLENSYGCLLFLLEFYNKVMCPYGMAINISWYRKV